MATNRGTIQSFLKAVQSRRFVSALVWDAVHGVAVAGIALCLVWWLRESLFEFAIWCACWLLLAFLLLRASVRWWYRSALNREVELLWSGDAPVGAGADGEGARSNRELAVALRTWRDRCNDGSTSVVAPWLEHRTAATIRALPADARARAGRLGLRRTTKILLLVSLLCLIPSLAWGLLFGGKDDPPPPPPPTVNQPNSPDEILLSPDATEVLDVPEAGGESDAPGDTEAKTPEPDAPLDPAAADPSPEGKSDQPDPDPNPDPDAPPVEQPSPLNDADPLIPQIESLVPNFIGEGPNGLSEADRALLAERRSGQGLGTPPPAATSSGSEGGSTASDPKTDIPDFVRAAEVALASRHVAPEERPIVRDYFARLLKRVRAESDPGEAPEAKK